MKEQYCKQRLMKQILLYNDPLFRQRNVRSHNKKAMNTDVYA